MMGTSVKFGRAAKFVRVANNVAKDRNVAAGDKCRRVLAQAERVDSLADFAISERQRNAALSAIWESYESVQVQEAADFAAWEPVLDHDDELVHLINDPAAATELQYQGEGNTFPDLGLF